MGSIDRIAAHEALDRLLDALAQETPANSREAIAQAQAASLDALEHLLSATGAADMIRRRIAAFVAGRVEGSPAEANELDRVMSKDSLTDDLARKIMARMLLDVRILPKTGREAMARFLKNANDGRAPPVEATEGSILAPAARPGIKADDTAAADTFRGVIAYRVGYTAGADGLSETRRLSGVVLARAAKQWNEWASRATQPVRAVKPSTIRDWCTSQGDLRVQFERGYTQGTAARGAKAIDRTQLLLG